MWCVSVMSVSEFSQLDDGDKKKGEKGVKITAKGSVIHS